MIYVHIQVEESIFYQWQQDCCKSGFENGDSRPANGGGSAKQSRWLEGGGEAVRLNRRDTAVETEYGRVGKATAAAASVADDSEQGRVRAA